MIVTIHKGKHRAWPPCFGIFFKKRWMERDFVFDNSCRYELPDPLDKEDVNKLFGFGYFPGFHHIDSARFGWNYNPASDKIRLYAYCYVDGKKAFGDYQFKLICEVPLHTKVRLNINVYVSKRYVFTVHDGHNSWYEMGSLDVPFNHDKKWSYRLGCFFGGNNPAPHDITIKISKK